MAEETVEDSEAGGWAAAPTSYTRGFGAICA